MDNKKLDEILQGYAESTKNDKSVAFKKLNENSNEQTRKNKKFNWKHMVVIAMSAIAIVLCIVLPITLKGNGEQDEAPTYCYSDSLTYAEEENISVFVEEYGINAKYPIVSNVVSIYSITSSTDLTLRGAEIEYVVAGDVVSLVRIDIIPKNHVLEDFESYFSLQNKEQWKAYEIKTNTKYNQKDGTYDMQIYFRDGNYDYFVTASSYGEIGATELLDILYA